MAASKDLTLTASFWGGACGAVELLGVEVAVEALGAVDAVARDDAVLEAAGQRLLQDAAHVGVHERVAHVEDVQRDDAECGELVLVDGQHLDVARDLLGDGVGDLAPDRALGGVVVLEPLGGVARVGVVDELEQLVLVFELVEDGLDDGRGHQVVVLALADELDEGLPGARLGPQGSGECFVELVLGGRELANAAAFEHAAVGARLRCLEVLADGLRDALHRFVPGGLHCLGVGRLDGVGHGLGRVAVLVDFHRLGPF